MLPQSARPLNAATLKQGGSDAKAHDNLDRSGTLAGSHGLAGQCAKPAAWRRPNPCSTQKRNPDRHAGGMLRGDRLLRLRPGLDQCLRSPLLSVRSLLAVAVNAIRGGRHRYPFLLTRRGRGRKRCQVAQPHAAAIELYGQTVW